MGFEIYYCSECRSRILGDEFSKGSAVWIGSEARCLLCVAPGRLPRPPRPKARFLRARSVHARVRPGGAR